MRTECEEIYGVKSLLGKDRFPVIRWKSQTRIYPTIEEHFLLKYNDIGNENTGNMQLKSKPNM